VTWASNAGRSVKNGIPSLGLRRYCEVTVTVTESARPASATASGPRGSRACLPLVRRFARRARDSEVNKFGPPRPGHLAEARPGARRRLGAPARRDPARRRARPGALDCRQSRRYKWAGNRDRGWDCPAVEPGGCCSVTCVQGDVAAYLLQILLVPTLQQLLPARSRHW
jgi:hypothetical protein